MQQIFSNFDYKTTRLLFLSQKNFVHLKIEDKIEMIELKDIIELRSTMNFQSSSLAIKRSCRYFTESILTALSLNFDGRARFDTIAPDKRLYYPIEGF